ncbi:MAG: FecR domain-containing protein [Tannerella sp.]|jgi:ferric-dicitrate binding protein FerR (iron transport regulator)|nr:FecR domain-containing protein [Tannerella sp.]
MQNQLDKYWIDLIVDHLTGAGTSETDAQLAEWRNASEENEHFFAGMKKIWDSLCLSVRDERFDEQRAYRLFKERVEAETGRAEKAPAKRRLLFRRVAAYAAVLIPFMILSYFTYRYWTTDSEPVHAEKPLLSEISVPNGSKTQMKLQDGTVVWLNAGSKIQYDADFGRTNRTCTLSGEAYLEVARNTDLPFMVETGNVTVKVLGTRFNVHAYDENDEIKVALLQGSVEMNTDKEKTIRLQPGEMANYHKTSGQTTVSPFTTEHAVDWMNNRFVFNGETFEQIINTLERSFNVKVTIRNDRIRKHRFAGDFINNETIEQIFGVMSANGKFRYRIKGNTIEVY